MLRNRIKWIIQILILISIDFAKSEHPHSILALRDVFRENIDRGEVETYCANNENSALAELSGPEWIQGWGPVKDEDILLVTTLLGTLFGENTISEKDGEAAWLCTYQITQWVSRSDNTNTVLRLGYLFRLHKVAAALSKGPNTGKSSECQHFVYAFVHDEADKQLSECRKGLLGYINIRPNREDDGHKVFVRVSDLINQYLSAAIDAGMLHSSLESVLSHGASSEDSTRDVIGYSLCSRAKACSKILVCLGAAVSGGTGSAQNFECKDDVPPAGSDSPAPKP